MVEKGSSIHKRNCPKSKTKKCVGCEPCNITAGFSGAGAFSDGKLSLSYEVGGDLPSLIGEDFAQSLIDYTDKIYLEFGADTHVEGINQDEKVKEIRKRAIQSGLKLVDCPIRHLGTEKAQEIYGRLLVQHLSQSCRLKTTNIIRVCIVQLLIQLLACYSNLLSIDHDYIITCINMRGKLRLILSS